MSREKVIMEKFNEFVNMHVSTLPRRKITDLETGRAYLVKEIIECEISSGKYLFAILLDTNDSSSFVSYLTKQIVEDISDDLIEIINKSDSGYNFTYLGEDEIEPKSATCSIKCNLKNGENQRQVTFLTNDVSLIPPEEFQPSQSVTIEVKVNNSRKRVQILEPSAGASKPKIRRINLVTDAKVINRNVETEKQVNQLCTSEKSMSLSPTVHDNIPAKCDSDLPQSQDSIEDMLSVFSDEHRNILKQAYDLLSSLREDEKQFLKEKEDLENDVTNSVNKVKDIAAGIQELQAKLEDEKNNLSLKTLNLKLVNISYLKCKIKLNHFKKMGME